ncbi:hypothetical protein JRC42_24665 (plasmid) [Escherichia albertii]|uniref:hypothetical protein n=1 Tax=Escherichia albertii TaxID=208962 RepID=UPI00195BF6A4|nr:hypothetical protein [Escherichia albertii]QST30885.1 hypothetical protein JRC42_24665 [Escherichia albertii]QST40198.1 hypothetical protein JRC46_24515 [Escherichia albertii]
MSNAYAYVFLNSGVGSYNGFEYSPTFSPMWDSENVTGLRSKTAMIFFNSDKPYLNVNVNCTGNRPDPGVVNFPSELTLTFEKPDGKSGELHLKCNSGGESTVSLPIKTKMSTLRATISWLPPKRLSVSRFSIRLIDPVSPTPAEIAAIKITGYNGEYGVVVKPYIMNIKTTVGKFSEPSYFTVFPINNTGRSIVSVVGDRSNLLEIYSPASNGWQPVPNYRPLSIDTISGGDVIRTYKVRVNGRNATEGKATAHLKVMVELV